MKNSQYYFYLKSFVSTTALVLLVACGGQSADTKDSLSENAIVSNSSQQELIGANDAQDMIDYTSNDNTNSAEQDLAKALADFNALETIPVVAPTFQQLNKNSIAKNTAGNIQTSGLANLSLNHQFQLDEDTTDQIIVKYKPRQLLLDIPKTENSNTKPAVNSSDLTSTESIQIAPLSASLLRVAKTYGLQLSLMGSTHDSATVYSLGKALKVKQAEEIINQMKQSDASIEYIALDTKMHTSVIEPNDNFYWTQWSLTSLNYGTGADDTWSFSDGTGVVVAVLDTGYRPHEDLGGRILKGYDFIKDKKISNDGNGRDGDALDPGDGYLNSFCGSSYPASAANTWHGTQVSGVIAANTNNSIGLAGIAYGAKILPVRVMGRCGGYASDLADGIVWASGGKVAGVPNNKTPAKIINVSLSGYAANGQCNPVLSNAINKARANGAIVVVAAGNEGKDVKNYTPANCEAAVTVGSSNFLGKVAANSNIGSLIDFYGPGEYIPVLINSGVNNVGQDNAYVYGHGSSLAAAHASASFALLLALRPRFHAIDLENIMKYSELSTIDNKSIINSYTVLPNIFLKRLGIPTFDTDPIQDVISKKIGKSSILLKNKLTGNLVFADVNNKKYDYIDSKININSYVPDSQVSGMLSGLIGYSQLNIFSLNDKFGNSNGYILVDSNAKYAPEKEITFVQSKENESILASDYANYTPIIRNKSDEIFFYSDNNKIKPVAMNGMKYKASINLDGDLYTDLILTNEKNGQVKIIFSSNYMANFTFKLRPGELIKGAGKFLNESTGNLLIQNKSGQLFIVSLDMNNGSNKIKYKKLYLLGKNEKVVHIGDYNGNGQDDILVKKQNSVKNYIISITGNGYKKNNMADLPSDLVIQGMTIANP